MADMEAGTPRIDSGTWEGLHGLRQTGIGRVKETYSKDATNSWLEQLGLAPELPDETHQQWHRRTNGGQRAGAIIIEQTIDTLKGGNNGH